MMNALVLARRELGSYYSSLVAYVIIAAFLVVTGYFFAVGLIYTRSADSQLMFQWMYQILLLIMPILTMRLLAEERRSGTIELLMTAPVRDIEIVIGKFFAGFGFLCSMLALTLFYPLILALIGNPDRGGLIGGYLGAVLFGGAAVAIGLLTSSLTSNQIVAAVLSFAALLLLFLVDNLSSIFPGLIGQIFGYLAVYPHFGDMIRGIIDTKDVVFFLSLMAGALFLTTMSLEARRWR